MQGDNVPEQLKGVFCLSTAYLAPVGYYMILANAGKVILEQHEHFIRQTYRNRCVIPTANGLMPLTIPVEKLQSADATIRDIRISEHGNWQQIHWKSIEAAYNSSPFFEYYADEITGFYNRKWTFLWDFNMALQEKMSELLDIEPPCVLSDHYVADYATDVVDLRNEIHPKKDWLFPASHPYYQVFSQKNGFQKQVSIMDLLFNMGNEAILILKS